MKTKGFTLIEVLIALSIVAIALTALLKSSGQVVVSTQRLKDKSIAHIVAMQAIYMIQLGLLPVKLNQEITEVTSILSETWYWRAKVRQTLIPHVEQISISLSQNKAGPFGDSLLAFRYEDEE